MTKEEAIKIVRENMHQSYDEGNIFEALKTLVPELSEGEDERIRKEIIGYLTHRAEVTPFVNETKDCERWISYLEKQEEQKPADIKIDNPNVQKFDPTVKITTSDSSANGKELLYVCNKSYDIGFRDGVASVKPAEWSEEDKYYYDAIIAKLEVTQDDALLTDNQIDFLKSIPERFNIQPKQVWNEEDDATHTRILGALGKAFMGVLPTKPSQEDIEWFKTIPERFNIQPKQEWSKEDEKMLDAAIDFVKQNNSFDFILGIDKDFVIDWLKSLRPHPNTVSVENATKFGNLEYERGVKDGIQHSENHRWKPSRQQMAILSWFCNGVVDEVCAPDLREQLRSLYNDLKKL